MSITNKSASDRWRQLLEESEQELSEKTQAWENHERLLCNAIIKISRMCSVDGEMASTIARLREAVSHGFDETTFESAFTELTDLVIQDDHLNTASTTPKLGHELSTLLQQLVFPDGYHAKKQAITQTLTHVDNPATLALVIQQTTSLINTIIDNEQAQSIERGYSALISGFMFQLLERLGLPNHLRARVEQIHKKILAGIELENWSALLDNIDDMATEIRSKINRERLETEDFLRNITARLDELDQYVRGGEKIHSQSIENGKALDVVVKREAKGISESLESSEDFSSLKSKVNQRLKTISHHVDNFRRKEEQQYNTTEQEVKMLHARLKEMERESNQLHQRIHQERLQALLDPLTKVGNRLAYNERIQKEFVRWKRFKQSISLVIWDIDYFKRINDQYGHLVGDQALKGIAKIIASRVRETDFFARYGGEEFVLIMVGTGIDNAQIIADKLRATIEKTAFQFRGTPVNITLSCGIAEFQPGDTPEEVFSRADIALYQAKSGGRNRVMIMNAA